MNSIREPRRLSRIQRLLALRCVRTDEAAALWAPRVLEWKKGCVRSPFKGKTRDDARMVGDLDVQQRGKALVGKHVFVFWEEDKRWYGGKVVKYGNGFYEVHYEDGDEQLEQVDNMAIVMPSQDATSGAGASDTEEQDTGTPVGSRRPRDTESVAAEEEQHLPQEDASHDKKAKLVADPSPVKADPTAT